MTLATIREKQKAYPEARAAYEKLLALNPGFVPALNNRPTFMPNISISPAKPMSWHRRHAPSTPATLRWSIPWAGLPTNEAIIRRP